MGYARYIGRVGALAVALGIGVALANAPAAAWADSDEGASSGSSSSTSDASSGARSKSDSSGAAGSTGASSGGSAGGASVSADGGDEDATGADADDGETTGGGDTAKKEDESGADNAAAEDDSGSGSDQPAAERNGSRGSQRESVRSRKSEVEVRSEAGPSAKRSSAATTVSNTPTAGAGDTAPQAVSVSETRRSVPISVSVRSADVVDVKTVSTTPPAPAKTATTPLLSALGLSPSANGEPTDVPESPVAWAMFAALRRQTDEDAGTGQKLLSVADPVASTLSAEGGDSMLMASVASAPVVGSPDQVSGAVLVGLNPVGPSGNPLTYTVTSQPVNGTVTVVGASATYTPTVAARLVAGSTAGVDFDSFAVSDGQTSTSVSVPVLPAVWVSEPQVSNVTGSSPYGVALVGNTAYVANQGSNTVSVINTLTGQSVGSPIVVDSAPTGVVASPDGAYVYVANRTSGTVSVIRTSNNTVVDINPGTTAIDSIKVGTQPEMIAVNTTPMGVIATGARLYVTNYGSGTVSVIDVSNPLVPKLVDTNTATPTTVDAIKVGSGPRGIGFAQTANGPRLYVVNSSNGTVSVIDAVTNKVIDTNPATATIVDAIKVGSTPQQIAISPDGKTAYVANYGSNTVSIIDTVTNKVIDAKPATTAVDAIAVRSNPNGVAVSVDGSLVYVANGDDRVSVIDAKTKTVVNTLQIDTITENNAHVLAVRADGSLMITDLADRALRRVTYQRGNTAPVALGAPTVDNLNPASGAVTGLVNIKDWDDDSLSYSAVVSPTKGSLTFNPADGTYTYTPTLAARDAAAQNPGLTDTFTIRATDTNNTYKDTARVTITIDPKLLAPNHSPYASPTGWGSASDLATGVVIGQMNGGDPDGDPLTYSVWDVSRRGTTTVNATTGEFTYIPTLSARLQANTTAGYDLDGINVAVSDGQASANHSMLTQVVPARLEIASPKTVGQDPTGVAVNGDRVFVLNESDRTLSVINTTTNSSTTIALGGTPTAVAVSADGMRAYITLPATSTVTVVDTINNQIIKNVTVGASPAGLAVSADGRRVYVTNSGSNTVSVIDTDPTSAAVNTEIRRITVGSGPSGIAVTPDGRRLFVTLPGSDSTAVVDTVTNAVTTVGVGDSPRGVAVTPDGRHAYVVNNDGTVSVIDTAYTFAINRIAVGPAPVSIAMGRDGTAYVANANGTVSLIDTRNQSVFATVAVDPVAVNGRHYVAVNNDGTRIYVSDTSDDVLRVLAVMRGNTAPQRGQFYPPGSSGDHSTVGSADPVTGSVSGTAFFVDPERDPLTYTASTSANGSVVVNPTTGTFTYTPSQAARDYALTTPENETDTMTITASDGQATTSTTVTVPVAATGNVAPQWQDYTSSYDPVTRRTAGTFNVIDADSGDVLRYTITNSGWAGTATQTGPGQFVYTPFYTGPNGYWNYDWFEVTVTDGHYTTIGYVYVETYTEYCGEACAL